MQDQGFGLGDNFGLSQQYQPKDATQDAQSQHSSLPLTPEMIAALSKAGELKLITNQETKDLMAKNMLEILDKKEEVKEAKETSRQEGDIVFGAAATTGLGGLLFGEPAEQAANKGVGLGDIHSVVKAQRERLDELAVALPNSPLDMKVMETINSAKLHHQDPTAIAKILATVADSENTTALAGMVEGKSFDLSSVQKQLDKTAELISGHKSLPSDFAASDIREKHVTGPAADQIAAYREQHALEQQALAPIPT